MATLALLLSFFANARCNLVKPTLFELGNLFPNLPDSIGLWCFATNDGDVIDAREYDGDSEFEAARVLGTAALLLGALIWIFFVVAGCLTRAPPLAFQLMGLLALCTCGLQGLVFLVYQSDLCAFGCILDTGGKCGISATVFWFVTGVTSLAASKALAGEK